MTIELGLGMLFRASALSRCLQCFSLITFCANCYILIRFVTHRMPKVKTVTKLVKTREVRHIGPDGQPVDLDFAAGPPSDFIQYPPHSGHPVHPGHPGFLQEGADGSMSYFEGQPPSPANYDAYYSRPPPPAGPAGAYPASANFQVHKPKSASTNEAGERFVVFGKGRG